MTGNHAHSNGSRRHRRHHNRWEILRSCLFAAAPWYLGVFVSWCCIRQELVTMTNTNAIAGGGGGDIRWTAWYGHVQVEFSCDANTHNPLNFVLLHKEPQAPSIVEFSKDLRTLRSSSQAATAACRLDSLTPSRHRLTKQYNHSSSQTIINNYNEVEGDPPRYQINFGAEQQLFERGGSSWLSSSDMNNNATSSYYGFRRNPSKQKSRGPVAQNKTKKNSVPIATIVLTLINVGIFVALWNFRIDPAKVALSNELSQLVSEDLGKGITAHLSHFEIWHIGFNLMTWTSLGPLLEQEYGSIPVLLWTLSFLPLTTLLVMILSEGIRRWAPSLHRPSSSMVGFSGILFAWMVIATLSQENHRPSCPIFFLPNVCFHTHKLTPNIHFNLGPFVQLLVLQVLLPRVSFVGHLAGILLGFVWHWNILLPPLAMSQPCILFPMMWMVGKYYAYARCFGYQHPGITTISENEWQMEESSTSSSQQDLSKLYFIRNISILRLLGQIWILGVCTAYTVSDVLLLILLHVAAVHHYSRRRDDQKQWFNICLRGYVGLSYVIIATDGLTLGSWIATWGLWVNTGQACGMLLLRDLFLLFAVGAIVEILDRQDGNDTHHHHHHHEGGTWYMVIYPLARHNGLVYQAWQATSIGTSITTREFWWLDLQPVTLLPLRALAGWRQGRVEEEHNDDSSSPCFVDLQDKKNGRLRRPNSANMGRPEAPREEQEAKVTSLLV